ncbi:MAG: long-chain acyl-CoA synthetase [Anaerophaga sp.]|uniref:class I adenylate-forming enzyme family protein n=1 Tax=Anaerophaga thermohalophila TaxID=177400 RepID=UPI000237D017|nr:AMP-binding protein [Anaerophaga thermohalophila]MDI3520193.1 long-chain acyl-CoA synthetase [Anaerophaga sp.]MDK2840849.1 long-chain acyl-CoA synthetase [Anaerophaga sp.]
MNAIDYFFQDSAGLDKELLISGKEYYSYREISCKVYRLSRWFSAHFCKGDKIILISPNNSFFVTVYLAVMKAGCVVVPLNPGIELSNLEYIVSKTGSGHAFLHSSVKIDEIPGMEIFREDGLLLDDGNLLYGTNKSSATSDSRKNMHNNGSHRSSSRHEFWSTQELTEFHATEYVDGPDMKADDPAQIIFTSGSTAVPKGVMISHGNLVANTNSILKYLNLDRNDNMLVVLPFFYCYGLSLLHTHLRVGGTLVLNNNFMFLGSVLRDLRQYKCTGFAGVPSHFQILLRKSDSFRNGHFPHLRYVTQAGGKLHKAFIAEFTKLFPEVRFFVMYGQTEATARLSYLPPEKLPEKPGSIGKGIPGVILKVIDEKGNSVIPGQTGEIIAKGENIMLGYFGDEEATQQALKDGWLHTGDLGTIDEDGYIYLNARKKEIIKVAGKRVGPKEIEEVIVSLPGVIDCTVEGYDHPELGEAIRAVVVKNEESVLTTDDIRSVCARNLASYKVPTEVVFQAKMKTSSTGKKVKGAL